MYRYPVHVIGQERFLSLKTVHMGMNTYYFLRICNIHEHNERSRVCFNHSGTVLVSESMFSENLKILFVPSLPDSYSRLGSDTDLEVRCGPDPSKSLTYSRKIDK